MIYFAPFSILGLLLLVLSVKALDCYRCRSDNGSHRQCEDPFNSTMPLYEASCKAARSERRGLFPGNYCFKIKGKTAGRTLYIRDCSVQNMQNMCGEFKYNGVTWSGCIQTCKTDGCNNSNRNNVSWLAIFIGLASISLKFNG